MSQQHILIVGAGALGITCAYHLQLAGTRVAFLVRPHRLEALARPQSLYAYHDHTVKQLEHFEVFSAPEDLRGQRFDYALLTLDGATCRSESGVATLQALGETLGDSDCKLIINGVGLGLYEHVQATTGLDKNRLLRGTMKTLAYQVGAENTPRPPAADAELHDSADIAYYRFPDGVGFILAATPRAASKAFAGLYDQSGEVTCQRLPTGVYAMSTNSFAPFTIASELNGWQGTQALVADAELWHLCCEAKREIMRLRRFGLLGKLSAKLMSDARWEKTYLGMEEQAAPIGLTAFNRFHHGGKVLGQNVLLARNCIADGEAGGQDMSAARELLRRWDARHAEAGATT